MTAYYNEIDPYAAQWLRNLIAEGHIAPGDVDERSIEDVVPSELSGYTQCHFFAGIGVWSLALRQAGWPDDKPVWTGSCPCQPFSAAGKGAGFDDERHLWPSFHWLIDQCRPPAIFGEQVASKAVEPWIELVQADLEAMGYAFGCVAFPSAGVGAPHIRDRAYWVGNSVGAASERNAGSVLGKEAEICGARQLNGDQPVGFEHAGSGVLRLADSNSGEREQQPCIERPAGLLGAPHGTTRVVDRFGDHSAGARGLADTDGAIPEQPAGEGAGPREAESRRTLGQPDGRSAISGPRPTGPTNGLWRDADWLFCRDGKWRPVEPGTFPLAHGAAQRVGRLRAYGNAINAEAAQTFIGSYLDATKR